MAESSVRKYYLGRRCSCAEVILRTTTDCHWLDISEQEIMLLENFCISSKLEDICAAYVTALAVLHCFLASRSEHIQYAPDIAGSFQELFRQRFGSSKCSRVKLSQAQMDVGCLHILIETMEMMEEFIGNLESRKETVE